MPKLVPPEKRKISKTLRISPDGLAWINQRAREEGLVNARGKPVDSEIMRRMMAYAMLHMPRGWRPKPHDQEGQPT